jgi:hypothetical protein
MDKQYPTILVISQPMYPTAASILRYNKTVSQPLHDATTGKTLRYLVAQLMHDAPTESILQYWQFPNPCIQVQQVSYDTTRQCPNPCMMQLQAKPYDT